MKINFKDSYINWKKIEKKGGGGGGNKVRNKGRRKTSINYEHVKKKITENYLSLI